MCSACRVFFIFWIARPTPHFLWVFAFLIFLARVLVLAWTFILKTSSDPSFCGFLYGTLLGGRSREGGGRAVLHSKCRWPGLG